MDLHIGQVSSQTRKLNGVCTWITGIGQFRRMSQMLDNYNRLVLLPRKTAISALTLVIYYI
jgi:hypothetical protein